MASDAQHGPYREGERIPGTQYKFVQVLGEGGHGYVVRAEHAFLGKRVAIKLLHPEHGEDSELVERMLAEARLLARIEHPNIVSVIDGGMTADRPSRPYFVMDELRGKAVSSMLKSLPQGLGLAPSIQIALGVLDGLDFAHTECGVIHRDIKPANVFLHRSATDTTVPKVLDFGIAHFSARQAGRTGRRFIGTPRYTAPEQLAGESPTARTDLYALGLVLYECVYGQGPFARFADFGALVNAHLNVAPEPLRELMDGVPPELDALVLALLAKDPAARPASAATAAVTLRAVAEDLRRAADRLTHKVQHRTEPTPMANMMVTTRAAGSERRLDAAAVANDTEPGGYIGPADTTPGAPPFEDVVHDTSPSNGIPFASTQPSPVMPKVDRNAETRLRGPASPRRAPQNDTDRISDSFGLAPREAPSEPIRSSATPLTSTAGVASSRQPTDDARERSPARRAAYVVGSVAIVAAIVATTSLVAWKRSQTAPQAATRPPPASAFAASPQVPSNGLEVPGASGTAAVSGEVASSTPVEPSAVRSPTPKPLAPSGSATAKPLVPTRMAPRVTPPSPSTIGFD